MKIGEMFAKRIERDLKGVIKVGQDDNQNVKQELEEYVVTRELQKHFRDFFEAYKQGITGNTDKMGVWISGFFGSGKSHFLKILSYLLENKEVGGKTALSYFEEDEKIKDPMVLADMRLAASVPTDVILFNIDSKSEMNGKENKEAILSVFLKVFNEMQGFYGAIPALADVERNLTEIGRYEEFESAFEAAFGTPWKEARSDFDFIQDDFVDVLVDMDYMSEAAARNLCEKATRPYAITIEDFAALVKKYLDSKENNHHLVFLVDEIGQYIGDNSALMLNLQTVVENLGIACKGKAWVIVTSQQDIDAITKTKGNDFSKIQGRFDTRLSLSSANVDEVIRERILKKTETAAQTLALYYDEKETIIKNLILFRDSAEKKLYASRGDFAEVYPFVPYQFNLLGSVLTAIRIYGASGKHLAEGERSMLALFKESAVRLKEEETGKLVPFHMFYDALEQFLDHSHKGVISRALDNEYLNPEHAEDCFDVNVLKTLFMIKYIKEIKANIENITSLMIADVEDDRMEVAAKVDEALKRLIRQTLVQKNGDLYVFLTDEEQEINLAIKNQPIDAGEITAKVSELIFDGLFDEKKYRYPAFNGRYAFAFNQIVDDKPYKTGQNYELTLKILTPNSDERADETTMRMLSAQSKAVLVVLPEDRAFLDEIQASLQIEKFLRADAGNNISKYEQIKLDKKGELRNRSAAAKLFLEEALRTATIYVNGDQVQTSAKEVTSRINDAIGKQVASVYHKLSYIDTAMSEQDMRQLLHHDGRQLTLEGTNTTPNSLALQDMRDYIGTKTSQHIKTSMKALLDRFTKAPYGFVEADVQWMVIKLFQDGDVAFYVNSEPVTLLSKGENEILRFVTRREFQERLLMEKRVRATKEQKRSAILVMKELFGVSAAADDEDSLMQDFMRCSSRMRDELSRLENEYYRNQPLYPGRSLVAEGKKMLNDISQIRTSDEFFAGLDQKREDYLDFAEDYEPVKKFFHGDQLKIFDKALQYLKIYDDGKTYIVDEQIESTVSAMRAIMKKPAPYAEIKNLPELMDKFMQAYTALFTKMAEPILAAVEEARGRVLSELDGKLCKANLVDRFLARFRELSDKADATNNMAILQNVKTEADALKIRCLKEIADAESKLQAARAAQEAAAVKAAQQTQAGSVHEETADYGSQKPEPMPTPKVKKQKILSIKNINNEISWQMETAEDVRRYVAQLEEKLLAQLEEDTVLHVEF